MNRMQISIIELPNEAKFVQQAKLCFQCSDLQVDTTLPFYSDRYKNPTLFVVLLALTCSFSCAEAWQVAMFLADSWTLKLLTADLQVNC